ncbi:MULTISPECIES: hypothetical protein [unclassified Streptomyces]|uniref:hypothetical protein n=1 Tax=unclassified Streptomyces TaxID=2593676 RepID=UPI001301617D|nr:hypothetical protein [Streptomyces sp. CB01580]
MLLALVAGGLAWTAWFRDADGDDLADRCQGSLAGEEYAAASGERHGCPAP